MKQEVEKIMLNDAQERCLMVTLRLLEEHLLWIEKQLGAPDEVGILKEVKNDVPVSIQAHIREKISIAREDIELLSKRFHLPKTRINTSTIALASLSYCWEMLEDATSVKLKKFGDTAEELRISLDPPLNEILDVLLEMESLLRK